MKRLVTLIVIGLAMLVGPGASVINSYRFAGAVAPSYFIFDTFTDSDGTLLASHTGETGATWTQGFANVSIKVQSNRIFQENAGVAVFTASGTPPSADYTVKASVRFITVVAGTLLTLDARSDAGHNTCYRVQIWDNKLALIKDVSSTETQIGSDFPVTWNTSQDYEVKLVLNGTSLEVFLDGVSVIGPHTDGTITTAGVVGFVYASGATGGSTTTGMHTNTFSAYP